MFGKKITLILALVFVLSFSVGMMTMHTDDKGNMSDCPFLNSTSICQMSFSEHMATFQGMFRAVPVKATLLSILILALSSILYFKDTISIYSLSVQVRSFVKNNPELLTTNKLLLALSDGIIQPKLYNNT